MFNFFRRAKSLRQFTKMTQLQFTIVIEASDNVNNTPFTVDDIADCWYRANNLERKASGVSVCADIHEETSVSKDKVQKMIVIQGINLKYDEDKFITSVVNICGELVDYLGEEHLPISFEYVEDYIVMVMNKEKE
jgi:hypothetical protein